MKNILSSILFYFFPISLTYVILNVLGHKINKTAKVGFSFIWKTKIILDKESHIGHFNIIYITSLKIGERGLIRNRNIFFGDFKAVLKDSARIGNQNRFSRSNSDKVVIGQSTLYLGVLACITKKASIDLTSNVTIGNYSQIAGIGTQIWTHGYVHAKSGPDRFRVDGAVKIGTNVYIGSGCLINPGVEIAETINVGGNCTISKSLTTAGMYVSQPLRHLPKNYQSIKDSLIEVKKEGLIEKVFEKKI